MEDRVKKNLTALALGFLMGILCARASAQDMAMRGTVASPTPPAASAAPTDPTQFGTQSNVTVLPTMDFQPVDNNTDFYTHAGNGYYRSTAGGLFWMGTNLPPGIQVHNVCISVYDNDPAGELAFSWGVYEMGVGGNPPGFVSLLSGATGVAAVPGYTSLCVLPPPNTVIRGYADADGDGDPAILVYRLTVVVPNNANIRFGAVQINWSRAVSTAPAVASFPVDVPTTHPYFRFVEALAAAGITGGTGGGTFSPDAPLTRGQMAVFLSAALGLWWPF